MTCGNMLTNQPVQAVAFLISNNNSNKIKQTIKKQMLVQFKLNQSKFDKNDKMQNNATGEESF